MVIWSFHGSPQSVQGSAKTVPHIWPQLLSTIPFLIHCSLNTVQATGGITIPSQETHKHSESVRV